MKKIFSMFSLCILFALIFSGCSKVDDYMEKLIEAKSGIFEDEDYIQYQILEETGLLNQEGYYNTANYSNGSALYIEAENQKQVHVTFADNDFLDISYYYDAELTMLVDTESCYLDQGESIYASQPKCNNPNHNNYIFSSFRVCEYDAKGNRGAILNIGGDGGLVMKIPVGYQGTELSVEPTGEYKNKRLTFCADCLDSKGTPQEVFGRWTINDEDCIGDEIEVPPSMSYTIRYYYDEEEYYYVSSSPNCYSYSDEEGEVEFKQATSFGEYENYSVRLHQYVRLEIECDSDGRKAIKSVKVNKKEAGFENDTIDGLKCGDEVVIETDNEYRLFCSQNIIKKTENLANGYRYIIRIPKTNEIVFHLKVSKSQLKVILDKSVGNGILFDIEASGLSEKDLVYEKQRFSSSCTVFDRSIGTEEELSITAKNSSGTLQDGCMLKLSIVKEDNLGGIYEEICYIEELPGKAFIEIYKNGEITSLVNIYKKITITISQVELMKYQQPSVSNATFVLQFADVTNPTLLENGCTVDASRKVTLFLRPEEDYYVAGKNVVGNIYSDTMKFSKYSSDAEEIFEKHPVKKLCHVTLDAYCPFGTCIYKVDGEEVSGSVVLKEEQELTLEYELTNSSYEIVRESSGFGSTIINWAESTFSKNKKTVSIPISSEIDGRTIKREDYITVIKKED